MFSDDDLLPISALQHLLFCERQCALIHVEQLWAENRLTVEGQHLHRKAHDARDERRGRVWIVRSTPCGRPPSAWWARPTWWNSNRPRKPRHPAATQRGKMPRLHPAAARRGRMPRLHPAAAQRGRMPRLRNWKTCRPENSLNTSARPAPRVAQVTPVEYKRGRPKSNQSDAVQLCRQAVCLEEMLGIRIAAGALFYGRTRRRTETAFNAQLRGLLAATARRLHELVAAGRTPPARYESKCRACSLVELCLPKPLDRARTASRLRAATVRRAPGVARARNP